MSLIIVTSAQLGTKKNLKTADILPVIDVLAQKKVLKQVICHSARQFYFPNTTSAIPTRLIPLALLVAGKMVPSLSSRETAENVFDFLASRRLQKADVVLFHPRRFERTMVAAKKNGSITVCIAGAAHPFLNKTLHEEEYAKLGLTIGSYPPIATGGEIANTFDYIIAMSDFVRESYENAGFPKDKIFVATLDTDIERFKPRTNAEKMRFQVLYVADTQPLKGLHYLLEAWTRLNIKDAELLIVGSFSIPKELENKYQALMRANPSIRLIGHAKSPEEYYQNASVFVLPSLTEGFPKVVTEAMASGLPVITTENARALVEDGKTGFVVPIRDAKAIAEKIQYLYDHRDIAERMGKEARKAVENKKPFGEAVYEICQEILRREKKI